MVILKLAIIIAVLIGIVKGMNRFNEHCLRKFGHAFFTRGAFWQTAAAVAFIVGGNLWRLWSAAQPHGYTLEGSLLMVAGIAIVVWLVYTNLRETNLVYGVGGSILQIGIFSSLAWLGVPALIIGMICQFLVLSSARPVYVVDRQGR